MFDIDTITTENGAEITVCQDHQLELCNKCCMDFTEMNQEAISDTNKVKAISNANKRYTTPKGELRDPIEPGEIRVGTEVQMPDRSGRNPPRPLDGIIIGIIEETDDKSEYCGEICYLIQELVDNEMMTYPVDWVHDEWLVKLDGMFIPASQFLASAAK
ncbi:hypothetical protein PSHT_10254 [Puccinia striiformis]|uniref:Uncharacterized protein n=1 Tax=Puccinia striiformis TaxID=27350 RepID=A0A2S4VAX3_9BASI|nr:hypothetical protein PSHT_10254 [Puccinia striiformis]